MSNAKLLRTSLRNTSTVLAACDCGCGYFVAERTDWNNTDEPFFEISLISSRLDQGRSGVISRLKAAGKALFGKPTYYSSVALNGKKEFAELVEEMQKLLNDAIVSRTN